MIITYKPGTTGVLNTGQATSKLPHYLRYVKTHQRSYLIGLFVNTRILKQTWLAILNFLWEFQWEFFLLPSKNGQLTIPYHSWWIDQPISQVIFALEVHHVPKSWCNNFTRERFTFKAQNTPKKTYSTITQFWTQHLDSLSLFHIYSNSAIMSVTSPIFHRNAFCSHFFAGRWRTDVAGRLRATGAARAAPFSLTCGAVAPAARNCVDYI